MNRSRMRLIRILVCLACIVVSRAAEGFDIFIDYRFDEDPLEGGMNFFDPHTASGLQARQALNAAAAELAGWLNDPLAPIEPGLGDTWNAYFFSPVTSTLATKTIADLEIAANSITIFAGGFTGGSSNLLGQAGRGSYTGLSGSPAFLDSVLTRGGNSDYVMWGGMVRFKDRPDWHLDHQTLPGSSQYDFYTVALHELVHVLGFGQSPTWTALRSGLNFYGSHSVAVYNKTDADTEDLLNPVPLADSEHWNNSIQSIAASDGVTMQDTLMGPTLFQGQRLGLTELDLAGIADIGWEVTGINFGVIPEPRSAVLFGGVIALLLAVGHRRGRRKRAGD